MQPPRFLIGTLGDDEDSFVPISASNPLHSRAYIPDQLTTLTTLTAATITAVSAAIGAAVAAALIAAAALTPLKTTVSSAVLPTGAATETTIAAISTKLGATLFTAPVGLSSVITTSATITTVAVQVIGTNAARKGFRLYNNSANSVYFTYSATPCTSSNITGILATFANYTENQPYTGPICAIRNAGTGTVTITELI